MSKKKVVHWHRIEGWNVKTPNKRFAVADKFYDNLNKATEAASALNRRFSKPGLDEYFKFEACEHLPEGVPFSEKGGKGELH